MPILPNPKTSISALVDHTGAWDWEDAHVSQSYTTEEGGLPQDVSVNDIVEAGTVLISAGPADLDVAFDSAENPDGARIVPIGLVETVNISTNKPLSRIFEIGSKLSYIIPGRTVGGMTMSRVFFDGPSLLKALYAGEVKEDAASQDSKYAKFISNKYTNENGEEQFQEFSHIGSGNLAMNLASSFFDQPVGLSFLFKDQQADLVGHIYFEGCRVSAHNLGISANMNVLTESLSMEFIRCRPVVTRATYDSVTKGIDLTDRNIVSPNSVNPTA